MDKRIPFSVSRNGKKRLQIVPFKKIEALWNRNKKEKPLQVTTQKPIIKQKNHFIDDPNGNLLFWQGYVLPPRKRKLKVRQRRPQGFKKPPGELKLKQLLEGGYKYYLRDEEGNYLRDKNKPLYNKDGTPRLDVYGEQVYAIRYKVLGPGYTQATDGCLYPLKNGTCQHGKPSVVVLTYSSTEEVLPLSPREIRWRESKLYGKLLEDRIRRPRSVDVDIFGESPLESELEGVIEAFISDVVF